MPSGRWGRTPCPPSVAMLDHQDKYVRRHAVWALGKLGPLARTALPDLCEALRDPDPRTASGAAQALGSMGAEGADAVLALAEAMRGTNIVLCRLASKALSQIGWPALATLIAHLQHADPFVRGEAALALGWMGVPARSAVPFLAAAVRGPHSVSSRTPAPGALLRRAAHADHADAHHAAAAGRQRRGQRPHLRRPGPGPHRPGRGRRAAGPPRRGPVRVRRAAAGRPARHPHDPAAVSGPRRAARHRARRRLEARRPGRYSFGDPPNANRRGEP